MKNSKPDMIDQVALEHLAARRARDLAEARKALARNTLEPNIEKKQQRPQTQGANQVVSDEIFTATQAELKLAVPPDIEKRYVHVGNKFYHPKNTDLVAFEDKGNKLETNSNSETIAGSMVRIAEARGWDELKVSGSEAFRREVWLAAAARGMQVKGYTPTDMDKAALAKRMKQIRANKVEINEKNHENANPDRRGRLAPKTDQEHAHDPSPVLTSHGAAKYMHDPKNSDSYYITTRDSRGQEKTTWGIDLQRAVSESGAKIGDRIVLTNEGKKSVTIQTPIHDQDGQIIAYEEKHTHRNAWNIQRAEAFRQSPTDAVKKHPELAGAAATIAAIEKKVQSDGLNAEQRAAVMARVHENVVNSIERGQLPNVKMREHVETQRTTQQELSR